MNITSSHKLRLARTTARPYSAAMQSVAETSIFSRRADALLTREERMKLIGTLAADPKAGVLIPGLGGIRKLRFAAGGKGKSGAFRVIYYVADVDWPILALLIYGKGEQENITPDQQKALLALLEGEKAKAAARRKTG